MSKSQGLGKSSLLRPFR